MPENSEGSGKELATSKPAPPMSVPLGPRTSLDLSYLPEDERTSLMRDYARGMLDLNTKAQELHMDIGALEASLRKMTETTKEVAEDGGSVTISHTQTSAVGRTEVIMGNTDRAKSGKLTKSQTGERDWTPYYVLGALAAAVLIAIAVAN